MPPSRRIEAIGDYNGDAKSDLVWRNSSTSQVVVWMLNGTTYNGQASLPAAPASTWRVAGPR